MKIRRDFLGDWFLGRPAPLRGVVLSYVIFSLFLAWAGQTQIEHQPQTGSILFWQTGGIYIVNPDGTGLRRISRALLADQRFTEVSAGCHGLVDAPCWVLIGHVLYHTSGRGLPLPLLDKQVWVDAPASWSPDGVHLVYPALNELTGNRNLLIFDILDEVVWLAAENVDDSIKPAWSHGCRKASFQNCFLAYAYKGKIGQKGVRIAVRNLKTWQIEERLIPSGLGNQLRWSEDGRLYYGTLNWYDIEDGIQVMPLAETPFTLSLSPTAEYVVYIGDDPGPGQVCRLCATYSVWLGQPAKLPLAPIYSFAAAASDRPADHEVIWTADGEAFATFQQGQLLYHNLRDGLTSLWCRSLTTDLLGSYAFSPGGDALALVEGTYLGDREKPLYRFFVVSAAGEVATLRPRSADPIVVLAWLPQPPKPHFLPRRWGEYARQFQRLLDDQATTAAVID